MTFTFVAEVVVSNDPTVVAQDLTINKPARASYMKNAIRVLPALPLQPVVLKRRGKMVYIGFRCCCFLHASFYKWPICVCYPASARTSFPSVLCLFLHLFLHFCVHFSRFIFFFAGTIIPRELPPRARRPPDYNVAAQMARMARLSRAHSHEGVTAGYYSSDPEEEDGTS